MAIEGFEDIEAQNSQESSVVRSFVAAEPVSDVKKNVAAIRRPFVASENRDKGSCQEERQLSGKAVVSSQFSVPGLSLITHHASLFTVR